MATPQSDETRAIANYLAARGVAYRITSSTNHPALTLAGYPSLHLLPGTNGVGRALDLAGVRSGRLTPELLDIFDAFQPVEHLLYELIYAGAAYNIKRGQRVPLYAVASHADHVHVAVNKGVLLPVPAAPPAVLEDDMPALPADAIVSTLACTVPTCPGGWWELSADGHVTTEGTAHHEANHYFGSIHEPWMASQLQPGSRFTAIGPRRGAVGYTTWGVEPRGSRVFYEFGPGIGTVPAVVP